MRHRNLELHDSSLFLQDYNAADVIVMTLIRCVAVLYSYYQFCHLHKLGSKYILGKSVYIVAVDFEMQINIYSCRGQLKCDGTRAETRFRLSAKRTSPLK
jgi:hypothetical protein